ncbi:transposase [Tritonibacter horizontis]|uniref:transposase n=1 Tax=Tritonibacter horizontis TaxID=1768241 RepID=UPI001E409CD7|nr:transposase [Tritonibacter horizontis]
MTKDTISETAALKALLSETADHQILAEMLGFVADRLMALDVDQLCGAGAHERSTGRMNRRNGYRERRWETRAGAVDVQIPKLRKPSLPSARITSWTRRKSPSCKPAQHPAGEQVTPRPGTLSRV